MLKILVPASEAHGKSAPSGGWPRVAAFIGICAVLGIATYGFAFDSQVPSTTPTRGVIPFALAVVLAALLFARRLPLSKPRVDLLYYSLAALSAAILYVDNADQRATVQNELDRQRLEFIRGTVKRQDSEVARLRAGYERAAAELSQAETSLPSLQQEFNAAKRVARTALEAIEKAHDDRCTQVWRECPLMSPRIERDATARSAGSGRLVDPLGCEARRNSCVLGARSTETASLRSLLGSSRLDDLAGMDVGGLPETPLQTDRGMTTLRSSVEQLVSRARQMPTLRARRDSAEGALQVAQTELEAQRRAVGQIETNLSRQGGGTATPSARSSPFGLEISFMAKLVWGWVLVVLLGLKLAREPFVPAYREVPGRGPESTQSGH